MQWDNELTTMTMRSQTRGITTLSSTKVFVTNGNLKNQSEQTVYYSANTGQIAAADTI